MKLMSHYIYPTGLIFTAALIWMPVQTFAHHAFSSEFDFNKSVNLTGTVTMVRWINPHGRILVDIEDANGDVVNWDFELPPINLLIRQGWKKTDLQIGDSVTISGHQARDDRPVARATLIRLSNGELLFGEEGRGGSGDGTIGGGETFFENLE